jgi:hypothetical protein
MKLGVSLLHGLALAAINVGAVLAGFAFYKVSGVESQLAVQLPVAVLISVVAFALGSALARRLGGERFRLRGVSAHVWTYFFAFAWLPALVVPLHYLTQGYLTSFANVYYTWLFQAPTNVAALAATYALTRRKLLPPPSS